MDPDKDRAVGACRAIYANCDGINPVMPVSITDTSADSATCAMPWASLEMLACAPIRRVPAAIECRDIDKSIQEIEMIGFVARWGSNALLAAMAVLTYALFVLAK